MRCFRRFFGPLLLLAGLSASVPVTACPNCKEAVASQTGDAAKLKDGYYYSIIFMIAMPFTLLGTGVVCVVRAVKRGALPEM